MVLAPCLAKLTILHFVVPWAQTHNCRPSWVNTTDQREGTCFIKLITIMAPVTHDSLKTPNYFNLQRVQETLNGLLFLLNPVISKGVSRCFAAAFVPYMTISHEVGLREPPYSPHLIIKLFSQTPCSLCAPAQVFSSSRIRDITMETGD